MRKLSGQFLTLAGAAVILSGLSACATKENCDPNKVNDPFQSAACNVSGKYDERQEDKRAELDQRIRQTQLTRAETEELRAESAQLAADRAAWERRVEDMQVEMNRLQLRLNSVRADNDDEQATLDALQAELNETQADLAEARNRGGNVTVEEVASLQEDVERKRRVIEAVLGEVAAE